MFSFSFFKVTNVFICLQPPLQSLPALFLPPSLQGSLVAFSWRGNPRPSFYSFSLSTALDIIESIFLEIFLADNSGFQILLLQMLIDLGFIFSQLPDHLTFPPSQIPSEMCRHLPSLSRAFYQPGCWQK